MVNSGGAQMYNKRRSFLYVLVALLLVCITIGYAYLNKSYIAGEVNSHMDCYDVYAYAAFMPLSKVMSGDGTEENPYKLGL